MFLRAAFYTLGCKVNQYETAVMEEQFIHDGFELVDSHELADVYVLNSCTVTAESDKKSRQLLRRFRRQNLAAVVALCGCFPQAFPDVAKALPEADIILGTSNKKELLAAVKSRLAGQERIIKISAYTGEESFAKVKVSAFETHTRAFIKIQDGCERYCAYCIIPHARGPVRSKPLAELVQEIEGLAAQGFLEVVLVGINLSCYGQDFGKHLTDAVHAACSVEGIRRVRLGSLEPELLDYAVIQKLAQEPKLCPQFHLSLQSGCDTTLHRMNRHYDTAEYAKIVNNLRGAFPGCAITTDLMVGFPGETQEEFEQSLAFAEQIGFAKVHVFAYSRRSGTAADQMQDQIPTEIKVARSKQMIALTNRLRQEFLQQQLGTVHPVLFETQRADGLWEGYTPNYTPVTADGEQLHGQIIEVHLTTDRIIWGMPEPT